MASSNNSGSLTTTYTQSSSTSQSSSTVVTTVTSQPFTRSKQIADYFIADLEKFVRYAHIDLVDALQIPPDVSQDTSYILALLYEDISHMLRDQLIMGIHLLLCENELDPNTGSYPLRYHVSYSINNMPPVPATTTSASPVPQPPKGNELQIPPDVWRDARFALLIDWDERVSDKHFHVRRPNYCFDWIPEEMRFDAANLIQWQQDNVATGSAEVNRAETVSPAHQKRLP